MDNGYAEAILLTEDGHVSEGSAEHVFIVRDGQLISPPSTADNLDGITRQSLITLAREDLESNSWSDRSGAPSCTWPTRSFCAGRARRSLPVRSVDRRTVGDGLIGPVTRRLSERFEAVVRGRVPRASTGSRRSGRFVGRRLTDCRWNGTWRSRERSFCAVCCPASGDALDSCSKLDAPLDGDAKVFACNCLVVDALRGLSVTPPLLDRGHRGVRERVNGRDRGQYAWQHIFGILLRPLAPRGCIDNA